MLSPASHPSFNKHVVQGGRTDGYWIEAFPYRTAACDAPDLIGYGLNTGEICRFINPSNGLKDSQVGTNDDYSSWKVEKIAKLQEPVGMTYGDITSNGFNDIIITLDYGPSMDKLNENGGRIIWLENTGDGRGNWAQHYVGHSAGMHRLRTGHFTGPTKQQIAAFPVISKAVPNDGLESPVPVSIFTVPNEPKAAANGWPVLCANDDYFHIVHDIKVLPAATFGGLDKLLVASREGISILWYNGKGWSIELIGTGLPPIPGSPFWGAGGVDVGKAGADRIAYIASVEAFHGSTVSVYVKPPTTNSDNIISRASWTRHVLDVFGPVDPKTHTGCTHFVVCGDFDGDGVDEFLVALVGFAPTEGVWYYKPVDLPNGKFVKWKVSDESAGRIAVGDFRANGSLDFATISYAVKDYHEAPNPAIRVYLSNSKAVRHSISATRAHDEVVLHVPEPDKAEFVEEIPLLDVAGKVISLVLLPPGRSYSLPAEDGIKVIAGVVCWETADGKAASRQVCWKPQKAVLTIAKPAHGFLQGDPVVGAIFIRFTPSTTSGEAPYSDMSQVTLANLLPDYLSAELRNLEFPFVKVEDREWGKDDPRFKGVEFYNSTGIYIRYDNNADDLIVHMQLWTAGVGVSAGFHNHSVKSFCEVHSCIVNGTGKGGMWWTDHAAKPPTDPIDRSKVQHVYCPSDTEHGPLWDFDEDGSTKYNNAVVSYPWHAWLAGEEKDLESEHPGLKQSFDIWMAYEFPKVDKVLESMS